MRVSSRDLPTSTYVTALVITVTVVLTVVILKTVAPSSDACTLCPTGKYTINGTVQCFDTFEQEATDCANCTVCNPVLETQLSLCNLTHDTDCCTSIYNCYDSFGNTIDCKCNGTNGDGDVTCNQCPANFSAVFLQPASDCTYNCTNGACPQSCPLGTCVNYPFGHNCSCGGNASAVLCPNGFTYCNLIQRCLTDSTACNTSLLCTDPSHTFFCNTTNNCYTSSASCPAPCPTGKVMCVSNGVASCVNEGTICAECTMGGQIACPTLASTCVSSAASCPESSLICPQIPVPVHSKMYCPSTATCMNPSTQCPSFACPPAQAYCAQTQTCLSNNVFCLTTCACNAGFHASGNTCI